MKNKAFYYIMMSTAALAMAGCVDTDIKDFDVEKPGSLARVEYLNDYAELKSYVDRSANPNFKLGAGVAAASFVDQSIEYRVACANFDEVTAGNAMKYASCVAEDGSMDFGTVMEFVSKAKDAGVTIYGHTLAWHSQQNNKYLNSLLKDRELDVDPDAMDEKEDSKTDFSTMSEFPFYVMGYKPDIVNGVLVSKYPGEWYQYFVMSDFPTVPGREYKVTAYIKASTAGQITVQMGNWGATNEAKMNVSEEWAEQSVSFTTITTENSFVVFQPGTFEGDIEVQWVKVTHTEAPAVEMEQELYVQTYQDGPFPYYPMGSEPPVIDGCIHFVPTGDWAQFFVVEGAKNVLDEGDYVVYLDLTASKEGTGVQLTMQNGWGGDAQNLTANVPLVAGNQKYRLSFPGVKGGNYDVILKPQTCDATLDLRSVTICKLVKMNTLPLTDEEKKDTLTWAMDNWITGMMNACEGYVTTWDVVNEAIAGGGDDGEGFYPLQSASTASAEDAANCFYWQDYLGSVDYVRTAVRLARERFAESGGNESDLKLFINDYNLESDWDDNKKLKSLIHWIEKWEADGVTKIDGIGSQMHVSCYANEATQESKKNHVVKMLELMAATGKLVKISELDMGYVDADGNSVKTEDMTEEQHKAMAEYYKFIINKYFEIIPAGQRYGITQWALTDSPSGSGWRANEPIGLWDLEYYRKHTYAGFADGLESAKGK